VRLESGPSNLFWSPNSEVIAFAATVDGKRGTYTLNINEPDAKPVFRTDKTGANAQWLRQDDQTVWLCEGQPGVLKGSQLTPYPFSVNAIVNPPARNRAAFGMAWRHMRDSFYDRNLNNLNWNSIYDKYADEAQRAPGADEYSIIMSMMLGELNASHTGYSPGDRPRRSPGRGPSDRSPSDRWRDETAHLGVRFDPDFAGPGWKVRDILPKGPADRPASRIKAGEVVLSVDGTSITKQLGLPDLLNGPPERDVRLTVSDGETSRRLVTVRPISYNAARRLLRDKWLEDNEKAVDKLSSGTLGYLHIDQMSERDFQKFEIQVYEKMVGKDGLAIDIRYNRGGSIADKLLGILCLPNHAITRVRDREPGYLASYPPNVAMRKPLVVICCQDCYSNAEIFAHAIKTLRRGKLVGVKTSGEVIATPSRRLMDLGSLRIPGIGFYVANGQDMELRGAEPDCEVWPLLGEMPRGKDRQLEKAVELLLLDVSAAKAQPGPRLIKASER
jgi:tricorn protease